MELWFRQYHGETCDPRWLGIASAAGPGCTPGHVLAVWCALKECASKSKPRGRVDAFDARTVAEFFMWPREQVDAIVVAIAERGMVCDGAIVEWADRQPVKKDATAAKRMRAYRERQKGADEGAAPARGVTASYGVTGVDGDAVTPVTATEEKEQSKSSFSDASRQEPSITLKSETSCNVRVRTGAIIDRGSFWQWLAAHGMPAHIGIRTMQAGRLSQWIEQGRGLSPAVAGLILLPTFAIGILVTALTGRRSEIHLKLVVGSIGQIVVCVLMLLLGAGSPIWFLLVIVAVFGVPQGLVSLANQNAVYHQARPDMLGASAGLLRTFMYIGAMVASSGTGFFFGSRATTPGLHGLSWFMLVIAAAFLVITLLDRAVARVGRDDDETGQPGGAVRPPSFSSAARGPGLTSANVNVPPAATSR